MPVEPDQIYRHANGPHVRLRVMAVDVNRADVFYLHTGRGGRILLDQLHDSALTKGGQPRRTGYVLETATPTATTEATDAHRR